MNKKAFLNILLSTTITLLLISAIIFYIISYPKESASSARAISEEAVKVFANASENLNIKRQGKSNNQSNSTSPENGQGSFSIVGRTVQE
ncbi:hypothetical protein FJZ18_02580 [Candidatus Pacearchaeota archaeon]|nr:hypothetical protein [Candidatus Pacearchaeota archaeon]